MWELIGTQNITHLDDLGNLFLQTRGPVTILVDTDHPDVVSVKVTGVVSFFLCAGLETGKGSCSFYFAK
jgi:hypothetical protein